MKQIFIIAGLFILQSCSSNMFKLPQLTNFQEMEMESKQLSPTVQASLFQH